MLRHIPFYASLLNRQLANDRKATTGVVLLYGAIEVHSQGERGCIASNETLARETGLTKASVAAYLSTMNKSGWIYVTINAETNQRTDIKPLLEIADPFTPVKPPFYGGKTPPFTGVKHRYIKEDSKNNNVGKENASAKKYGADDVRLTGSLYLTVAKLFPTYKKLVERKPKDADYMEINKLHRLDGNDYKLIEDVMKWLYTGYKPSESFDWRDQIKTTYKLRKHFDDLRTQYEKDKKTGRYRQVSYDTRPPAERKPQPSVVPRNDTNLSPEEAEKNRIVLDLVRLKKIAISDMKMMKSKSLAELKALLDSV